jgi:hypothetical protein
MHGIEKAEARRAKNQPPAERYIAV